MTTESVQRIASPSSPRKRQLGFETAQEANHPSTVTSVKGEKMDHNDMEDIWAELGGGEFGSQTDRMDYDDILDSSERIPDLSMPSPAPVPTPALKSASLSDGVGVASTASAKTTPDSSNPYILTPSMSLSSFDQSPVPKDLPVTSTYSSDSIAQMLEYMRACNSQPPPPPASYSSVDSQAEEERQGGRKREKCTSRTSKNRKQLSPIQKIKRSFSHGGEGTSIASHRPVFSAIQQRARQRSKTFAVPPPAISSTGEVESLHIDTHSAVRATGLTEATWKDGAAAIYAKQTQSASSVIDAWSTASTSPTFASRWQTTESSKSPPSTSHGSQKHSSSTTENLSLMDFLVRPEGAMWFQHFQKQYAPRASSSNSTPQFVQQQQQQQVQQRTQQQHQQVLSPLMNYPALPPSTDVAQMLGLQQAPNQALVQAFQTAFVLGMQQLGMARHFQQASNPVQTTQMSPPSQISSQQYSHPWNQQQSEVQQQQQQHHHQMDQTMLDPSVQSMTSPITSSTVKSTYEVEAGGVGIGGRDASSVLQSLLHDINQHRPDQEEFSVDEFLAFVANTVESTGDEVEHQEGGTMAPEGIRREDKVEDATKSTSSSSKSRKTTEESGGGSEGQEKRKKKLRKKTISISGQLNGTHLDDVDEDAIEAKRAEEDNQGEIKMGQEEEENQRLVTSFDAIGQETSSSNGRGSEEGDDENEQEMNLKNSSSLANANNSKTKAKPKVPAEKEANKLAERRRRRRESHNAVERRRRDHINERIAELASLLPESMLLDAIAASTSGGTMPHIDLSLFTRRPTDSLDMADITTTLQDNNNSSHHELERKANALAPVHSSSETLALAQSKPNKGIILSKSVEYIKHLHEFCSVLREKNRELQQEMGHFKDSANLATRNANNIASATTTSYRVVDNVGPTEDDSTMTVATPPDLATWLTQYREKRTSQERLMMSKPTTSAV